MNIEKLLQKIRERINTTCNAGEPESLRYVCQIITALCADEDLASGYTPPAWAPKPDAMGEARNVPPILSGGEPETVLHMHGGEWIRRELYKDVCEGRDTANKELGRVRRMLNDATRHAHEAELSRDSVLGRCERLQSHVTIANNAVRKAKSEEARVRAENRTLLARIENQAARISADRERIEGQHKHALLCQRIASDARTMNEQQREIVKLRQQAKARDAELAERRAEAGGNLGAMLAEAHAMAHSGTAERELMRERIEQLEAHITHTRKLVASVNEFYGAGGRMHDLLSSITEAIDEMLSGAACFVGHTSLDEVRPFPKMSKACRKAWELQAARVQYGEDELSNARWWFCAGWRDHAASALQTLEVRVHPAIVGLVEAQQKAIDALKGDVADARRQLADNSAELTKSANRLKDIQHDKEGAEANWIELDAQHEQMQREHAQVCAQIRKTSAENDKFRKELRDNNAQLAQSANRLGHCRDLSRKRLATIDRLSTVMRSAQAMIADDVRWHSEAAVSHSRRELVRGILDALAATQ